MTSSTDRIDQVESTMTGILVRLEAIDKKLERLDGIEKKLEKLDAIEKKIETLDSRFFDFSMRIVSANSSAFWGVGIALLSAAIAFVVARVSGGNL